MVTVLTSAKVAVKLKKNIESAHVYEISCSAGVLDISRTLTES